MKDSVKVTIAIAVYNVERYIGKCLDSVLNQDFDDYEILVVDDRGTDNSIDIVKKTSKFHPSGDRIRVVHHEKNCGTGEVRNTCIKEAKGEFLFFMDGDDYLAPNSISLLYGSMISNSADIVMGNHQRLLPDGTIVNTSNYIPGRIESQYAIAQWIHENGTNYYPVATWNKLFRTSFLRENCISCVSWHRQEDILFALQTAFVAKSINTIPDVTYYWVQVEGSCIHHEVTEWHLKQYLDIFDKSIALFIQREAQVKGKFPKEIYWIITNRYFNGFITKNTLLSTLLSVNQKNAYLKHIRIIANHIKCKDEFGRRNKLMYMLVKMPFPYFFVKLMLKLI